MLLGFLGVRVVLSVHIWYQWKTFVPILFNLRLYKGFMTQFGEYSPFLVIATVCHSAHSLNAHVWNIIFKRKP